MNASGPEEWKGTRRPGGATGLLAATLVAVSMAASPDAHGQTPEQTLFGWDTPAFPQEEYEHRRQRAVEALAERDGVMLVFSGHGLSHGDTFRQLDDFSYLVGLELPQSLLVTDGVVGKTILFTPARDFRFASDSRPNDFPGRELAADPMVRAWLPDVEIREASGLEAYVDSLARAGTRLHVATGDGRELPSPEGNAHSSDDDVTAGVRRLRRTHPSARLHAAYPVMARLRSVKSDLEIRTMERGARITARAIVRASRHVAPGVDERQLEGAFLDACRSDGSQRPPFSPIIKSGPNSLWPWRILASHYDRRNRVMETGDMVIFDVGCELDGYVSDVGRTFPVTGTFTDRQREILAMEVAVSDRIIEAVRPGVTLADLKAVADAAIPDEAKPYMQVGLFFGHHLGLSTGDPVLTEEPLEPGMVFTVEPWYYNHDEAISVFTEDEILVTENGARNLTAPLPRRPEELEALMASGVVRGLTVDPEDDGPGELEAVVDTYVAAWNEPTAETRTELLLEAWAAAGRYQDPTAHVKGVPALVEHIGGFLAGISGGAIRRSGPIQRTVAAFHFPWEMVDRTGAVIATGKDTGLLDADGRILMIRGFFDTP